MDISQWASTEREVLNRLVWLWAELQVKKSLQPVYISWQEMSRWRRLIQDLIYSNFLSHPPPPLAPLTHSHNSLTAWICCWSLSSLKLKCIAHSQCIDSLLAMSILTAASFPIRSKDLWDGQSGALSLAFALVHSLSIRSELTCHKFKHNTFIYNIISATDVTGYALYWWIFHLRTVL